MPDEGTEPSRAEDHGTDHAPTGNGTVPAHSFRLARPTGT